MSRRYFRNKFVGNEKSFKVIDKNFYKSQVENLVKQIVSRQKTGRRDLDGGLYVGACGVSYMLYYLVKRCPDLNYLDTAKRLAEAHFLSTPTHGPESLGFLLGGSGIFAVNAALAKMTGYTAGVDKYTSLFRKCLQDFKEADPLRCGSDEMLVGRAGYLAGALWLRAEGVETLSDAEMEELCDVMLTCGREYSARTGAASPLMYAYHDTEYLGAGHGLAGILQMLLTVPGYLQHCSESAARSVRASVDWLVSLQTPAGNFPCATDELGPRSRRTEEELVHWCHGAPGTVYLLARAYMVWRDEKYMEALRKAANLCWERGLLRKGPGVCHGVAGTGYVFLLLYRLTGDGQQLARAHCCANFLFTEEFSRGARSPDCPLSLYEGWSGTVCFLLDILDPDKAAFPFSDVFT